MGTRRFVLPFWVGGLTVIAFGQSPSDSPPSEGEEPQAEAHSDSRSPAESEPLVTDRPDFTESTKIVPVGRIQWEGGYTFTYDREQERRVRDHTFPEALLRIGLHEIAELRVGWDGYSMTEESRREKNDVGRSVRLDDHDDGATDMSIGGKLRLLTQDGLVPDFSVIVQASVPVGSRSKTSGDVDPEIKWLWSYEITDRFTASGNVNVASLTDGKDRFVETAGSVSLAYAVADWLGTYVEYFGFYPDDSDQSCTHYLNGGFTFPVTDDVQFDIRAGMGLNRDADDFFTGVGWAVRF